MTSIKRGHNNNMDLTFFSRNVKSNDVGYSTYTIYTVQCHVIEFIVGFLGPIRDYNICHTMTYIYTSTVDSLLTNTPNNGRLPNNGHCCMHQLQSPYM